jgi:DNA primase small subunit
MMDLEFDQKDIQGLFDDEILEEVEKSKLKDQDVVNESDLKEYYTHLFPYKNYFKWFGKDESNYFERREFSFTKKGDIYIRFLCFHNDTELKVSMIKENPIKIDIGAVYNTLPKYRSTGANTAFTPVEKELVFDIDMTDYDDVRTCCSSTKICNKCWKYLYVAYEILDAALRVDFGFKSIMWVFSGRRGIHCWIGDQRARKLTNEGRCAISNFLSRKTININTGVSYLMREPLNPSIVRAINIVDMHFEEVALVDQEILNNKGIVELLKLIIKAYLGGSKNYNDKLRELNDIFSSNNNSKKKWLLMLNVIKTLETKDSKDNRVELAIKEIKLAIMYPRLDVNVSKHINHLLKSPFCVHPKTGMISVPLDKNTMKNFDLESIPKLKDSIEDFKSNNNNSKFNKYMKIFEDCIQTFK